jgi:DNA polymerase III epsilon subunit-like protein
MKHPLSDTIISFDVESTGFIPGVHSIISLGAVAYINGEEHSHFYAAVKEFPGAKRLKSTMDWWKKHPEEAKRIAQQMEEPEDVFPRFYDWIMSLPVERVLAANPSAFDSALLWWYLHTYCGEEAIGQMFKRHRALDIRTYISALFAVPYSRAERSLVPNEWSENLTITHNALDDAREQGTMLINLIRAMSEMVTALSAPEEAGAA